MTLLPVIERELRVAARGRHTYRNRFFAGLAAALVLILVFKENRLAGTALVGSRIFESITLLSLCVALLAGLFHTADAISEEVRDGTLGLLYLTDLRSIHVVLGKLAAQSIPALFALTTILPILAIPILLGGVTYGELARSALVLMNALWLSLCAGLLASCLARDDRATLLINLGLVLIPTLLVPMIRLRYLSPYWAMYAARDLLYNGHPEIFWLSMAVQAALPCLLLMMAALLARHLWREHPANAAGERRAAKWRVWSAGNTAERTAWRTEMIEENPALWLACRCRARNSLLWILLGGEAVVLTWIFYKHGVIDPLYGLIASVFAHWVLKVTVAFAACRAFSEEAHTGAFELLFTSGLKAQQLIMGHVWGMVRSFGPAAGAVMMAEVWCLVKGRGSQMWWGGEDLMWMRTGFLLFDLITIAIYGLAMSLKTERAGRAAARTLGLVIVLPNLAFALFNATSLIGLLGVWAALDVILIVRGLFLLAQLRPQELAPLAPSSARE